jgi:hypothetical protein
MSGDAEADGRTHLAKESGSYENCWPRHRRFGRRRAARRDQYGGHRLRSGGIVYFAGGGEGVTGTQASIVVQVAVLSGALLALLYLWLLLRWLLLRQPLPATSVTDDAVIRSAWDRNYPG